MRVKTLRTCESCLAENMFKNGTISLKSAKKFCECFKAGHDKTKIGKLAPLTKEYEEATKIVEDKEKEVEESLKKWKERSEERE